MTVTLRQIVAAVAAEAEIPVDDILSERCDSRAARARQIAMFLARRLTPHSLASIGRHFRRDHTTVFYAIQRVEKEIDDPDYAQRVDDLRARILRAADAEAAANIQETCEATLRATAEAVLAELLTAARRNPARILRALATALEAENARN